jgi:hypothetical protein
VVNKDDACFSPLQEQLVLTNFLTVGLMKIWMQSPFDFFDRIYISLLCFLNASIWRKVSALQCLGKSKKGECLSPIGYFPKCYLPSLFYMRV